MKAIKWFLQGLGIGAGVIAARIIHPTNPKKKSIRLGMISDHDKLFGPPWTGDNSAMRNRARFDKVMAHIPVVKSRYDSWNGTAMTPNRDNTKRAKSNE